MTECQSQPVNVKLWFPLVPNCTGIMLIVNIILYTSAICSATKIVTSTGTSVTSAPSTKSKRVVVDPGQGGHSIRNNQERSRDIQTTPRIPSAQDINLRSSPRYGNYKATDTQRASYTGTNHRPGSHAYGSVPKRPLPYVSSSVRQFEQSHRSNLLSPYFGILNNPNAYKAARSIEKPLDLTKSIMSLQKLHDIYSPSFNAFYQDKPIELSSFSGFEYPSYNSVGKIISQGVSSPTVHSPIYKMSYPLSKVTDYAHVYAPGIPTVSSITPSSDKITQSPRQKEATVDVNGKKISVPIIQLQSNGDFSGVLPSFESQPFQLSGNYPIESDGGFKFGTGPKFNMALQSSNVSPFSSPLSSFQGQVVPIQTSNGSPQFPQYKGASIEAYSDASNAPKARGNYESLYSQPQLHFDKERSSNAQPANVRQNTVHPSDSTQGILNDVEIINKKNPEPHTPQPDEDNDEDREDEERYKSPEKEYDHSSEDDDAEHQTEKFKAPLTESNFKPSSFYPFKEYDEIFGKYKVQSDDDEDKSSFGYKKYPSSDDEEEEDSSSEYRAEYTESSKPSRDSYEEEDEEKEEEESRKQEKRKKANNSFHEVKPKRSKYYQKDFEKEFEESYREELPKEEYVHVKEVPEIDSYINPSPSKQKNSNQSHVKHGQSKESKSQDFRISRKNRKTSKTDYKDTTAHSSDISAKRTPKVIYEEFYGYKKPKTGKYSKLAKIEKFTSAKKSPKEDGHFRAAKYYKFKSSKIDREFGSKDKDPDSFSSANNWKFKKNTPEETIPKLNVRQSSDSDDEASFYEPSIFGNRMRSLTNTEIFRDLIGI